MLSAHIPERRKQTYVNIQILYSNKHWRIIKTTFGTCSRIAVPFSAFKEDEVGAYMS